jgi:predicted nuclease with TOPRIM domain
MGKSKSNTNISPVVTTVRKSTRSKHTLTQQSEVDFTVEIQELTTKNKTLTQTNTKLKNEKNKLVSEHAKLTITYNDLTVAIYTSSENNVLLHNNNEVLYKKYYENRLGCNKSLKKCITQFEKEQNIFIEKINVEKQEKLQYIHKIAMIKTMIASAKNKLTLYLNKPRIAGGSDKGRHFTRKITPCMECPKWHSKYMNYLYSEVVGKGLKSVVAKGTRGGSNKSSRTRDPRQELQDINTEITKENKELKDFIGTFKEFIQNLKDNIAKLEVEKLELEEKQKTIKDANTYFDLFIQLVNNIQLLEKEYYNIKNENEKLHELLDQLNDEKMDLNRKYMHFFKSTVNHNTTVKKQKHR